MLEAAKKYVLSFLLENEEVRKFPKDFTTDPMKWIHSWFLKDDPSAEIVINLSGNEEAKSRIIEAKLLKLLENPRFVDELNDKIGEFEQHTVRVKNLVDEQSKINAEESVTIGDKGSAEKDDGYNQKNIVKGTIKAGKDVYVGDTNYSSGNYFNIVNQYFLDSSSRPTKPVVALVELKKQLNNLVSEGKTEEAISLLKNLNGQSERFQSTAIHLSGRWFELNRQKNLGVLNIADFNLEKARIDMAVLELIRELQL